MLHENRSLSELMLVLHTSKPATRGVVHCTIFYTSLFLLVDMIPMTTLDCSSFPVLAQAGCD